MLYLGRCDCHEESVEKLLFTVDIQRVAHLGEQDNIAQDAQKGRSARPQRAKRRGVRFGTLSL